MDKALVASMIDHAILKPDATDEDLRRECKVAAEYRAATVCVKPCNVRLAKELLEGSLVGVCTVIGFPHGSTTTACKVFETEDAIKEGASEIDMVINIGKLISGEYDYVKKDILAVVEASHKYNKLVKVIIEAVLLTDEQKEMACKFAEQAGAEYVKTSTGFAGGGATLHDIAIMKKSVSSHIKIKASGGIKNHGDAMAFINAGCHRLGTSSLINIME